MFCALYGRSFAPKRGCRALFTVVEDRLSRIVLGLVFLVLGLGIFLVRIVQRRAHGWHPRRQRDEERILRLPRCVRRWQPDTRPLLAANLRALGALDGPSPAPSDDHVRGQPDALFQWCTLTRDHYMGHLYGIVGVLLGHVQGNRGNWTLHRPGQTRNFLDGPFWMLVPFGSLGRQPLGKLAPRKYPEWVMPRPQ